MTVRSTLCGQLKSRRSIEWSRCSLRNMTKCMSACQSQFQLDSISHPKMSYDHQQKMFYSNSVAIKPRSEISSTLSSMSTLICPEHIIQSSVTYIDVPDVTLNDYIWANVGKWSNKIAVVIIKCLFPSQFPAPSLVKQGRREFSLLCDTMTRLITGLSHKRKHLVLLMTCVPKIIAH